ncbi:MAG TPA: tetratricopeptide repeat protein [Candidatus Acidoferrales bacterium]|nr:tetratricopeptide repeat protein [Candidatus Acidoferrales bacterium]
MRIALSDPRTRVWFSCSIFLIAALELYASGKMSLAAAWSASSNPQSWEAATRLEPDDAANWERLGLYREWNLENRNIDMATDELERAVSIDPLSAEYQLELASAEEVRGDLAGARKSYQAAVKDYPVSGGVAWRYGSFLLRHGDTSMGLSEVRRAIEEDPTVETTALAECLQANPNATAIIDEALPRTTEAYLAALDYFVSQGQTEAAQIAWKHVLALGQSFPMSRSLPLVDKLMSDDRPEDAKRVWDEALRASGWKQISESGQSVIFNGGFENDLVQGGFDWRELYDEDVTFGFDDKIFHSGKRALRIDFSGKANLDFQHLFTYAAIQPGQTYRFDALLRTENISTESGLRMEVIDPRHPTELRILTPNLVGTNPWTQAEATFQAPANTDLIEIILRRLPSVKIDNKLCGTVWLDDVSLTPILQKLQRHDN